MKPRTEAQKLASRRNGARSKGPVTPEGKAKVSLNAITHGIHAVNPVLQVENPEAWKTFLNDHIQQWDPLCLTEWDLVVNELAGTKWRLKRLRDCERALMDLEVERVETSIRQACARPDAPLLIAGAWDSLQTAGASALDRLHRHEARLLRIIEKAESRLLVFQAARQSQDQDEDQDHTTTPESTEQGAPRQETQKPVRPVLHPNSPTPLAPKPVERGAEAGNKISPDRKAA